MAKTTIWMPWFISDYLKDTITLTLEEDCLYRRALDFLWQNPRGIPKETHRLCSALRVDIPTLARLSWVLDEYLQTDGNYYRSKRIDEEYAKAVHNNEMQKKNGKLGGRPINPRDNPRDNPTPKPNETPSPSPSPIALPLLRNAKEEESPNSPGSPPSFGVPVTIAHANGKKKPTQKKKPKAQFTEGDTAYELAKLFRDMLKDWTKSSVKPPDAPRLQAWAATFHAMVRLDGRTIEDINAVLNGLDLEKPSKDGFLWRNNIQSPEKLREKLNAGALHKFVKEPEYAR